MGQNFIKQTTLHFSCEQNSDDPGSNPSFKKYHSSSDSNINCIAPAGPTGPTGPRDLQEADLRLLPLTG